MKVAITTFLAASLAVPALAQDAADLGPPPDFEEAAWQAEFDAGDTDGDGQISREEDKAALFRDMGAREGAGE